MWLLADCYRTLKASCRKLDAPPARQRKVERRERMREPCNRAWIERVPIGCLVTVLPPPCNRKFVRYKFRIERRVLSAHKCTLSKRTAGKRVAVEIFNRVFASLRALGKKVQIVTVLTSKLHTRARPTMIFTFLIMSINSVVRLAQEDSFW